MANWLTRLFGSRNQRVIGGYSKLVSRIGALDGRFLRSGPRTEVGDARFRSHGVRGSAFLRLREILPVGPMGRFLLHARIRPGGGP